MSEVHVLPIAELLRQNFMLEYIFDFYEDGFRGLIRDHVLASSAIVCDIHYEDLEDEPDPLENKIIAAYKHNLSYRHDYYNNADEKRLNDALNKSKDIRLEINRLMYVLFNGSIYQIQAQKHRWLGSDLVVHIDMWD